MKKIFITGAKGQLGIALRQLLNKSMEYEVFYSDTTASEKDNVMTLDITDEAEVSNLMNTLKPDIIINCAAMTAVDLCESEQEMAYRINALGPKYIAFAANKIGAKLVHISSDYVYNGQGNKPYTEEDIADPVSIYGKTKLAGDLFVIENCEQSFIFRTAWVYGEGKNFVRTMLRLAKSNTKVRVVADQFGTPTSALELARVILHVIKTEEYGLYHATCEGSTSWYEFARMIFKEAGVEMEIEPIKTSEYPTPAARPGYSVLDNKALRERHGYIMKDWKEAIKEYMFAELLNESNQ